MSFEMVTLGELCRRGGGGIQTGPFGSQLHAADYVEDGIPSVMPQNIRENSLSAEGIARVSDVDAERLTKHRLIAGDIVYSRRGDVEKRAWVRPEQEGWLCGTGCLRVRVGDRADSRFVSYALGTEDARTWIRRHAVGATMLNLNTSILGQVPLPVPAFREQVGIAEVLGALDDKIAANEAPNGSVERLLRAHLARLSDLPSAGPREISELIDFNPRCSAPLDPITFVDMNKLPTADSVIRDWGSRPAVAGGARFMNGDTLLARITPCLENRKTGFVDFLEAGEVGVGSTEFVVMRSRRGIAKSVSYLLATDEGFRTHAALHMTGTSGRQRVAAADLAKYEMLLPPDEGFRELGELATALFTRLAQARDENRTLAALRDTLLPELMAGRLRVKDAEHRVEEAL